MSDSGKMERDLSMADNDRQGQSARAGRWGTAETWPLWGKACDSPHLHADHTPVQPFGPGLGFPRAAPDS